MGSRWLDTLHLLYLVSSLVPKSANLWIFGAWFGQKFTDNPMRLFLHAQAAGERTCVWITRSRTLARTLRAQGYRAHYYLAPAGIWCQMRAGAAFFTHDTAIDMLGPAISARTRRFQLWHGTPLKKIRYGGNTGGRAGYSRQRRLVHALFPWKSDVGYDFVPAASEASVAHLKEAFRTEHVYVTGYPRNDVLVPGDIADARPPLTRCIYMPTFRGEFRTADSSLRTNRFLAATGFDVERLDRLCAQAEISLTLRLHPTNRPDEAMVAAIRASTSIRLDDSADIYEALNGYDLLITDYSSIFFDFFITGKPIVHVPFDLDDYRSNSRDLYFGYEDICLTPGLSTWDDVLGLVARFRQHGFPEDYVGRYRAQARRFNRYLDSQSCQRVYAWAKDHAN